MDGAKFEFPYDTICRFSSQDTIQPIGRIRGGCPEGWHVEDFWIAENGRTDNPNFKIYSSSYSTSVNLEFYGTRDDFGRFGLNDKGEGLSVRCLKD